MRGEEGRETDKKKERESGGEEREIVRGRERRRE